jgi:hypothetical protein
VVGVKPHSWFEDPPPERWFAEEEPAPGSGARPRPYAAEIEPATEDLGALSFPPLGEPDGQAAPVYRYVAREVDESLAFARGATIGLGLMAFCALVVLGIVAWPQVLAWLGWP